MVAETQRDSLAEIAKNSKRLIVLSAPSGAGKTTVARHLLGVIPSAQFSVSATTRPMRPGEIHGKDYYFLTRQEFEERIAQGDLIEYEEIFGNLYGTLRSAIKDALESNAIVLFDVDVKGALSLRKAFPLDTFLIFVSTPSREELERRLRARSTESEDQLRLRLERADMEMQLQQEFDVVLVNDSLPRCLEEATRVVNTVV